MEIDNDKEKDKDMENENENKKEQIIKDEEKYKKENISSEKNIDLINIKEILQKKKEILVEVPSFNPVVFVLNFTAV